MANNGDEGRIPPITLWVIYDWEPPKGWVARRWDLFNGKLHLSEATLRAWDLESLREKLKKKRRWPLGANITDDPHVLECWI